MNVRRSVRLLAATLAMALALVQSIGLLHGIVHLGDSAPAFADRGVPGQGADRHDDLTALFSGHDGEHDCERFDQMSHADLAVGGAVDLGAMPLPQHAAVAHPAWHIAAQARGFLARGPPGAA